MEYLISGLEAMAPEEEMESSIWVPEAVAPKAEAFGYKDDMVLAIEFEIPVPEESVS